MSEHAGLKGRDRRVALVCASLALAVAGGAWLSAGAQAAPDAVVPYTIVDGRTIPASLTGAAGDPSRGRALFLDQIATGCTACHTAGGATGGPKGGFGSGGGAPGVPAAGAGGDAIPLDGVGARLEEGELRLWLVDPSAIDGSSGMPGYYLPGQRTGIDDPLYNGPRLTAAEIEDLVAWLLTLKGN